MSEKSNIISIFEDNKKKKEGGSEKGGVKIRPFHLPWIHTCNINYQNYGRVLASPKRVHAEMFSKSNDP